MHDNAASIEEEILELEARLAKAKEQLKSHHQRAAAPSSPNGVTPLPPPPPPPPTQSAHFLLLLSDSALPLGSFAFSSGLESFLAHGSAAARRSPATFAAFLPASVSSLASAALPFVLAAHRDPATVPHLDDALDAAIVCTVGRRASVAQGRALLAVWERSFADGLVVVGGGGGARAVEALRGFGRLLKGASGGGGEYAVPPVSAHLAPLFGAIANLVGLGLRQTAYVFMLSHVKALVSAAVRAGLLGPYQAQKMLASAAVQSLIAAVIEREWDTRVEEAGQSVPIMDLWIGRHEMLYSRIFNS